MRIWKYIWVICGKNGGSEKGGRGVFDGYIEEFGFDLGGVDF